MKAQLSTTTATTNPREACAEQFIRDSGANYFNPFIGDTSAAETCKNLNGGFGLLNIVISTPEFDIDGSREGLELLVRTMWAAAQFEIRLADHQKGGGAA